MNILLLHGALGSPEQLRPLGAALTGRYNIHYLNFSGHAGKKIGINGYSIDAFSEELRDYIDSKGIAPCLVFGYSMGGYVAINTALQHEGRIAKIITLGTKFDWSPETAEKEASMLNPAKMEAKIPAFTQQLARLHAPLDWRSVVNGTAEMMQELGNGAAIPLDALENLETPVIILRGEKDRMVSREESEAVAAILPAGQYVEIPGVPHPIEQVPPAVILGCF